MKQDTEFGNILERFLDDYMGKLSDGGSIRKPNFESAKYFTGQSAWSDVVSLELRTYAAKPAKEEFQIELARSKVRELRAAKPQGDIGKGKGDKK